MTTPNMLLTLPVDKGSANVWDALLDTVFGLVDSHNHTPGRGVKVPTGGLNIDADISFSPSGTPRAITDLKAIDFAPVASTSVTGLAGAFFISDGTGGLVSGELYFRTVLGSNIQVTLGAALNVAAFAGGIGGDYITASALLSYDAATLSYWLQQPGAPRPWARMRSGDVDIYETAASIVNRVRLKSPAALAASYDVTWPAAVPGSTSLVQMSAAGVLTSSNTVANALTFSAALTVNNTIGTNNTITTSTSLVGAGVHLTSGANRVRHQAPGGLAANYDVTWPAATPAATQVMRMSSAGVITTATGTETRQCDGAQITISANAVATGVTRASGAAIGGGFLNLGVSSDPVWMPIQVSVGEVITGWNCRVFKGSAAGTITARMFTYDGTTETAVGASSTNGAASPGLIFLQQSGLSSTVAANTSYYIRLNGGGTTGDNVLMYAYTVTVSP